MVNYIYTPRVLQCMRFKHKSVTISSVRTVMDYEFDFCVGCEREMWIDDKHYKIERGCFVIRTPGQKVCTRGIYDCYMLTLDFSNHSSSHHYTRNTATQMQTVFESKMWDVLPSVFQPLHCEDYIRIFENFLLINEMEINENQRTLFLVNELLHLVISDAFLYLSPTENKVNKPIDEACSYIKNHYMEDIKLDDIAAIAHLNKNYLVRQFKKAFGISPISYLIKIRMDYAKKLLVESNLPIKTIAAYCGYNDPSFFNSYFKKTFSITPASYRRSQQIEKTR